METNLKNRLKEILSIQSYSYENWRMFAYLIRQAKINDWHYFVDNGNIYIEKGTGDYNYETVPCVVAHMDTVHKITQNLTVYETGFGELFGMNDYTVKPTGIGGDDKVGIFLALECLRKFDNIKVAFFRDEEVGCVGSGLARVDFFKNCSFILQGDRNGNHDFIIDAAGTELSSKLWQDAIQPTIKKFGYDFEFGSVTDVMQLKELDVECVMANVSCGYYNAHTENEYVNIFDVEICLEMFFELIENFGGVQYTHKYQRRTYNYGQYYKTNKHIGDWVYDMELGRWVEAPIGDAGSGFNYDDEENDLCLDCWSRKAVINGMCNDCDAYYIEQYGVGYNTTEEYKELCVRDF